MVSTSGCGPGKVGSNPILGIKAGTIEVHSLIIFVTPCGGRRSCKVIKDSIVPLNNCPCSIMDSTIRYGRINQGSTPCRGTKFNASVA